MSFKTEIRKIETTRNEVFWICTFIALLLGIAFGLICCSNRLEEGKVIDKVIEPKTVYMYMMPIAHYIPNGKTTIVYYTYVPVRMVDDEDYAIYIQGTASGDTIIERFYLSKEQFNCLQVGDQFKINEDCSNQPNEDRRLNE